MKYLTIIFLFMTSLPLYASPSMDQVDHSQREGIKIDLATDPHPSGTMHQHSENHEPMLKPAQKSEPAPNTKNKGLMGR